MQTQVFLPKTGFSVSGSPNPCFELSRSRFGSGIHLIEFSTLIFTRSPASKDSQPRVRIRKPSRDRHGLWTTRRHAKSATCYLADTKSWFADNKVSFAVTPQFTHQPNWREFHTEKLDDLTALSASWPTGDLTSWAQPLGVGEVRTPKS